MPPKVSDGEHVALCLTMHSTASEPAPRCPCLHKSQKYRFRLSSSTVIYEIPPQVHPRRDIERKFLAPDTSSSA